MDEGTEPLKHGADDTFQIWKEVFETIELQDLGPGDALCPCQFLC